jgi:hypothetical protein
MADVQPQPPRTPWGIFLKETSFDERRGFVGLGLVVIAIAGLLSSHTWDVGKSQATAVEATASGGRAKAIEKLRRDVELLTSSRQEILIRVVVTTTQARTLGFSRAVILKCPVVLFHPGSFNDRIPTIFWSQSLSPNLPGFFNVC